MSTTKKALTAVVGIGVVVFAGALAYALTPTETRAIPATPAGAAADQAALVEAGRYVAVASDCIACHTAPGGKPFAGGRPVQSPIGNMYSSNITPDKATGIGNYSLNDFDRAIRHGIRADGVTLYPAMPYPSYSKLSDQDMRALYAYFMQGVQPVNQANRKNDITWPLSIRWPVAIWRKRFAPTDVGTFQVSKYQSEALARGAYLVQGAGHCGTCHTPRASTMQELALDEAGNGGKDYLAGGALIDGWRAVNLRGDQAGGLGTWNEQDIVDTLKTGRNRSNAVVGGPMNDVVAHSTQNMTDADLHAIASYLKSLPAHGGGKATYAASEDTAKALKAGQEANRGAQLYIDNCAACHRTDGKSNAITFPALPGNSTVLADDPSSLIRLILRGSRLPSTRERPSELGMPGFAWRLSDDETAQLVTFVRNSWGNHAPAATASEVAKIRKAIEKDDGQSLDQANTH
ncbi:c-type cytochrome [Massilia forsythiae]|uniref:C-type cytochrome n=1 Tax=Massilia forsythiae TaxID=2728020 RepID=A0A7Z2ZV03_9BURK|nr:cytochrome c [Massilia forsythiae]QJE02964.1 c-type cytochrome [Massilia forsythiae]